MSAFVKPSGLVFAILCGSAFVTPYVSVFGLAFEIGSEMVFVTQYELVFDSELLMAFVK